MNQVSNYSYGEAEALTDEIEEQSEIVGEVLRIKEILYNSEYEVCYFRNSVQNSLFILFSICILSCLLMMN